MCTVNYMVADLRGRLRDAGDPATKAWFERYLKHVIPYHGVKTPAVRDIVADWRCDQGLGQLPVGEQLGLCRDLLLARHAEEKFAGTLYIQRYLLRRLHPDSVLELGEELFDRGAFGDWSTTDWFCVRVLGPLIARHGEPVAHRVALWRDAENLWQRRAAIVPLRTVCKDAAYHPLIAATVAALAGDDERFVQTGIGWVISDLSKTHPDVAATLVERHLEQLSPEVVRRHTRRLPKHAAYRASARPL